ncbi:hypothetical protein Trydic_g16328 [Trypoxylus dichotomus]
MMTLFFLLIYVWMIQHVSASLRQINYPFDLGYEYGPVISNTNDDIQSPKYIALPSSQDLSSYIKFIHSLTEVAPLADDSVGKTFGQQLKWAGYKKPTKYLKHTAGIKLKPSLKTNIYDKNCCEVRWPWLTSKNNASPYQLTQAPRRPMYYPNNQDYGYRAVDDVKPVVEHIEGDLKYDFRTGTHSI